MLCRAKRFTAFLVCAVVLISVFYAAAASAKDGALCTYSLSDFAGNEALVLYTDGTCGTFTFNSRAELAEGLKELSASPDVSLVQPNFSYTQSGYSVIDEYFGKQWALYNDGSFEMVEERNDFPVYDDPFGQPSMPGRWTNPWDSIGMPGMWRPHFGFSTHSVETITSVSGADINIEDAWNTYNGGERETVIALIDTGVNTEHEDFSDGVFWVNEDEIAGNGVDDDGNGYIDDINGWNFYHGSSVIYTGSEDSHGTHGAGSIAASRDNSLGITGIVSDGSVKLMILKVLGGQTGSGSTSSVIKAIQYAEANSAVICNMSMGTEDYDAALYRTMADSDMLFVASAGNDGVNSDKTASYPACFDLDNIISVANMQPDGTLHASSNYGEKSVDIAVPGSYILSLTPDDSYSYMTGTSMSAPILSAAAAMLYAFSAELDISDIKDILLAASSPSDALCGVTLCGGMLNVGAALEYVNENRASAALPFSDVSPESSYYDAVKYLYERGIMQGTDSTLFSPSAPLTRAMTVTLLGRLAGAEPSEASAFSDVKQNTWYSGYVGWAEKNGIVIGYGNGLFGTNDYVTAFQLDLILKRYGALSGVSYDSGLSGNHALTRAETAQALYELCRYSLFC